MRHFMAQFGPALQWPWTKLTDVPELTDELLDRIVAQSDEQAARHGRARDGAAAATTAWSAILQALRDAGRRRRRGAGALRAGAVGRVRRRRGGVGCGRPAAAPRRGCRRSGSTTTATSTRAATCRCSATPPTALLRAHRRRRGLPRRRPSYYTVETHLSHLDEARAGDELEVATQLLAADEKRLHLFHEMRARRHGGRRRPSRCCCTSTRRPAARRRPTAACAGAWPSWRRAMPRCPGRSVPAGRSARGKGVWLQPDPARLRANRRVLLVRGQPEGRPLA